jgi:hypothetical protein
MAPESLVDFKNASRGMREEGEDGQITTCEEAGRGVSDHECSGCYFIIIIFVEIWDC